MATLYNNIIALCEKHGIKGGKMCSDIGISKGLLTDLKMGRRTGVSAMTAQKIASYFNVSVGYLLGEEDKKEKPADPEVSGLTQEQLEVIRLFDSADPVRRQIALDILRAAEAAGKAGETP